MTEIVLYFLVDDHEYFVRMRLCIIINNVTLGDK